MSEKVRSGWKRIGSTLGTGFRRNLYRAGLVSSGLGPTKAHYQAIVEGDTSELAASYQRSILKHAQSNVPYYKQLRLADNSLGSFPILTKEILRRSFSQLTDQSPGTGTAVTVRSGGSTGEPVTVRMDRSALQWNFASEIYYRHAFLGIDPDIYLRTRKVSLWSPHSRIHGRTSDFRLRISHLVSRTTCLDPRLISETILSEYVQRINKLRPAFIKAISIPLYELAQHVRQKGIRIHQPLMIFTSGTTLLPVMRNCIEDVFGCQVYDCYSSREMGHIAGECSHGKLHVFTFNNTVEVVDPNGNPAAANQEGRLLLTSLHNSAMPLIRYEIGDLASMGSGECECGSPLPFLNRIAGRMLEYFPTSNGSLVGGGYMFQLFYGCDWISEFYVLQEDYDRIIVFYTCNQGEQRQDEDLERIASGIRHAMGSDCVVEWRGVERIPRTRHGKRLFTRSLVWEDRQGELLQDMAAGPVSCTGDPYELRG